MRIDILPIFHRSSRRWLPPLIWVYFTLLFGWLAGYLLFGDRLAYLALANSMAVYLFAPLPFVLAANLYLRRRELWWCAAAGMLIFLWLWGGLFIPRAHSNPDAPVLRIMTYNLMGHNSDAGPFIDLILEESPDVVFLQELNFDIAAAFQQELAAIYPYQMLDPRSEFDGSGVISKYPLRPAEGSLPLDWVGEPQVLVMDWRGQDVHLVNFHMYAPGIYPPHILSTIFHFNRLQAKALVECAGAVDGPVILAGDANAAPLNQSYKIITASLQDAWAQAGFVLGHTYPGADNPNSRRVKRAGVFIPRWFARIDYVFASPHFSVLSAHLAGSHAPSDHRAVLAELSFVE